MNNNPFATISENVHMTPAEMARVRSGVIHVMRTNPLPEPVHQATVIEPAHSPYQPHFAAPVKSMSFWRGRDVQIALGTGLTAIAFAVVVVAGNLGSRPLGGNPVIVSDQSAYTDTMTMDFGSSTGMSENEILNATTPMQTRIINNTAVSTTTAVPARSVPTNNTLGQTPDRGATVGSTGLFSGIFNTTTTSDEASDAVDSQESANQTTSNSNYQFIEQGGTATSANNQTTTQTNNGTNTTSDNQTYSASPAAPVSTELDIMQAKSVLLRSWNNNTICTNPNKADVCTMMREKIIALQQSLESADGDVNSSYATTARAQLVDIESRSYFITTAQLAQLYAQL